MTGPGRWLRAGAARVCRPKTMERLIDPIVADLRAESAALGDEKPWRRRRVLWSAYAGFWKALGLHLVLSVMQQPPEGGVRLRRAAGISFGLLTVFTILLTLPPLLGHSWKGDWGFRSMLAVLLIPQALPLSIPAAVCIGILYAMRAHRVTRRDLYGVLAIAVLASVIVWAVMAWGLPGANQAFRELVSAKLTGRHVHLEPGPNELGFWRLAQRTDPAALRVYHLRWALAFAALPLSLLALSIAQRIRGAMTAVSLAFAAVVAYYAALWVSDSYLLALHPGTVVVFQDTTMGGVTLQILSAWAPNAVFLAAALGLSVRWRHSRSVGGPSPP